MTGSTPTPYHCESRALGRAPGLAQSSVLGKAEPHAVEEGPIPVPTSSHTPGANPGLPSSDDARLLHCALLVPEAGRGHTPSLPNTSSHWPRKDSSPGRCWKAAEGPLRSWPPYGVLCNDTEALEGHNVCPAALRTFIPPETPPEVTGMSPA